MLLVVLEQRRRVLRETEEDVLLRLPDAGRAVDGTPLLVVELLLRVEGLAAGAVPPLVLRGVEVAGLLDAGDERLHARSVPVLGRADEVVVGDLELLPEVVVARDDPVGERDRRHPLRRRGLLDVLAVLVGPRQEPRLLADQPVVPRRRVRDDRRVDVPDVGQVVDVVDRRRRVEGPHAQSRVKPKDILSGETRRNLPPHGTGTPMSAKDSLLDVIENAPPPAGPRARTVDTRCLGRVVICSHLSTDSCGRPPAPLRQTHVRRRRTQRRARRNHENVVGRTIPRIHRNDQSRALFRFRLAGNRHPIETSPLRERVHFQASRRARPARSAQRASSFRAPDADSEA